MDDTAAGAAVLPIQGEFNIFTAAATKALLLDILDGATADVEVDLADVTEIDSAGLQLMVMVKREAAARGKSLRFTRHSGPVLDLLDLCDLSGLFGDPVVIRSSPL